MLLTHLRKKRKNTACLFFTSGPCYSLLQKNQCIFLFPPLSPYLAKLKLSSCLTAPSPHRQAQSTHRVVVNLCLLVSRGLSLDAVGKQATTLLYSVNSNSKYTKARSSGPTCLINVEKCYFVFIFMDNFNIFRLDHSSNSAGHY